MTPNGCSIVTCLIQVFAWIPLASASTWSEWWTYEGISGPDFWGLVNPEWILCTKGKKQSPVDISPKHLLYDPTLKHIHIDKHKVSGTLVNTGHDIRLILDESIIHYVNISSGPLSYQYRVSEILIHFGSIDSLGSEHTINGQSFPAEIQIIGFNTDIYGNMTQAVYSAHGLAIISIFVHVGAQTNPAEFEVIAQNFKLVKYKGKQVRIRHLSVHSLVPMTTEYMTYEGSLTQPGCHETATWMLINKPLYITQEHLMMLRDTLKGEEGKQEVPMENNCRPTKPLNQRAIRTNVNTPSPTKGCTMEKNMHYQACGIEANTNPGTRRQQHVVENPDSVDYSSVLNRTTTTTEGTQSEDIDVELDTAWSQVIGIAVGNDTRCMRGAVSRAQASQSSSASHRVGVGCGGGLGHRVLSWVATANVGVMAWTSVRLLTTGCPAAW